VLLLQLSNNIAIIIATHNAIKGVFIVFSFKTLSLIYQISGFAFRDIPVLMLPPIDCDMFRNENLDSTASIYYKGLPLIALSIHFNNRSFDSQFFTGFK